ncbi:MAG: TetR/AcrR family transcriptional regulator, partial [Muribaculaceae bacterium]|nr:TetR/AcrR family transcriptional regulator [Muribaculaceae bacterium]
MHKNNRQEILFQAAFKLFLLRQFKGVTLADIEQEAGMTRGAIFYHARNKEDLYRKVVKRYWIDNQDIINQVDKDSVTLKEFINNYTASINKMMQELQKLLPGCSLQQVSKAYLSFLMQLRDSAPDLHDEYLSNRTNQLFAWNDVLRNA